MNRIIAVAAVIGLLIGVLAGFLWWGTPTERVQSELREAQKRVSELELQVAGLKTLETRLKTTEEDLRVERDRRSKLEMILSKGRK